MKDEIQAKGIIISAAPQGEYGRRLVLLTDKLGKITAFAGGAAKAGSKIIGAVRTMTCASFGLAKGRSAYNLHSVDVIDAFGELAFDFDLSVLAMYVLEAGDYFSAEGMPEEEAKALLNLMYVTLKALREKAQEPELIRHIFELRLLVLQGEYTMVPGYAEKEETTKIWQKCISSSLTSLYDPAFYQGLDTEEFEQNAGQLFARQVNHKFRTLTVLRDL